MAEFIRADKGHKADVIDFINYVFSYAHCPHDFKKLLPKVYADDKASFCGEHYLAVEDNKIQAVITDLIIDEQVDKEVLTYGLIGNVSVHPYARGKGYMKALMKMAKEDAKKSGVDIMVLGGLRQRYGYFGFENAGANYRFQITKTNIRHCMKQVDCTDILFDLIEQPDAGEIDIAKALYESKPVHAVRPREDFLSIMHNWTEKFYAVKKNGRMIGYVYGNAVEVVLESESDLPSVLKAWIEQKATGDVKLSVAAYEKERISYLTGICERMSIEQGEMICVLNWKKVLRAFLRCKHRFCPLQDGAAKVCIEEEAFEIRVSNGEVDVERIAADSKEMTVLTHNEAELLFFGLQNMLNPKAEYKNWLPLPFFIDIPDTF